MAVTRSTAVPDACNDSLGHKSDGSRGGAAREDGTHTGNRPAPRIHRSTAAGAPPPQVRQRLGLRRARGQVPVEVGHEDREGLAGVQRVALAPWLLLDRLRDAVTLTSATSPNRSRKYPAATK